MSADVLALLDSSAGVLRATAPTLSGEGRYAALLSANAIATARRELVSADRLASTGAAVAADAAAIRAGLHDDDAALYDRLVAHAALRAWVTEPGSLTAEERARVEAAG